MVRQKDDPDSELLRQFREEASDALRLFSNNGKKESERMIVRAFLRCLGEGFREEEILSAHEEPHDVLFRDAKFQVKQHVGNRRPGDEWKNRKSLREDAKSLEEIQEDIQPTAPAYLGTIVNEVEVSPWWPANKYGPNERIGIDLLVYFNSQKRHLYPTDFELDTATKGRLFEQHWRSVSLFLPPCYATVICARDGAPNWLKKNCEKVTINSTLYPESLFDP